MPPKKVVPAALGGLLIGVLSALPVVNLGNLCCCLWVVSGGYLAAYLLQQDHPSPIATADGAVVGLLAGVFGAGLSMVISLPIGLLMRPFQARLMNNFLANSGDMPPGMREMVEGMMTGGGSILISMAFQFTVMLVVGVIFAPIGGILGAVFSRRPPVLAVPPDSFPPEMPPSGPPSG